MIQLWSEKGKTDWMPIEKLATVCRYGVRLDISTNEVQQKDLVWANVDKDKIWRLMPITKILRHK